MINPPITHREFSVIELLAKGRTTKEIATVLNLSASTVASHRRSLCRKFGAHSTAELVAFAIDFIHSHDTNEYRLIRWSN